MSTIGKAGIDYGLGKANVDLNTGIRYGVIPAHVLGQAWYDNSEGNYGEPTCPECGDRIICEHENGQLFCVRCQLTLEEEDCFPESPLSWYYENTEYSMEQGGDDPDVFVVKSPYYTYCSYCSPCAPGAGYLPDQLSPEDGIRAYCPGPDWFEDSSPVAIYLVETNERIDNE